MKIKLKNWGHGMYEIKTLDDDKGLFLDKTEMQDLASLMKKAGF